MCLVPAPGAGVWSSDFLGATMILDDDAAQEEPDSVVFVESPPTIVPSPLAGVIAAAEKGAMSEPVRVRVIAPYRVCHKGEHFLGGQTLRVPAPIADTWIRTR
jgi:hypothetical protein